MSALAAGLVAGVIALAVLAGLAVFAVWEHRRYHERQDALAKAVEAARKCATQGDEVDKYYRQAVIAAWGPRPRPVGIHPGGPVLRPGGSDAR